MASLRILMKPPADVRWRTFSHPAHAGIAGRRGPEDARLTRGDLSGRGTEKENAGVATRETAKSPGVPRVAFHSWNNTRRDAGSHRGERSNLRGVGANVVPRGHKGRRGAGSKTARREGRQVSEMNRKTRWGRVMTTNGQGLPETADDRLSAIKEDKARYPRWTSAMVDAIPKLEAQGRKWFQLYDKIADAQTLKYAWDRINARTKGAARTRGAGVDAMTVEGFAKESEGKLKKLAKELKSGRYRPSPIRRHYIPKPGSSRKRPLGLPTIRDRVVQEAVRGMIEPIFEARFYKSSHGFRPGRSTDSACLEMEAHLNGGKEWIVDADIKGCFDNIPHKVIVNLIAERISDGKILKLIESMLKAGVMEGAQIRHPITGTPQGGVISPLLCNVVLHELDAELERATIAYVRYADDFVLLCRSREEAEESLDTARGATTKLGLELSDEKTRIAHLDEGFDFLGWNYRGNRRRPRRKSIKALRAKVKAKTRRNRPGGVGSISTELEPQLRGWFNYFRNGDSEWDFASTDGWLRRRLRSILKAHRKGHSGISSLLDNKRWPNSYFKDRGLYSLLDNLVAFRKVEHAPLHLTGG